MKEPPKDISQIFWKKEITMGQALGFLITILTLVVTGWMDMRISIAEHETRINIIEKSGDEIKATVKEGIRDQANNHTELLEAINQLKLDLKDKQDRN